MCAVYLQMDPQSVTAYQGSSERQTLMRFEPVNTGNTRDGEQRRYGASGEGSAGKLWPLQWESLRISLSAERGYCPVRDVRVTGVLKGNCYWGPVSNQEVVQGLNPWSWSMMKWLGGNRHFWGVLATGSGTQINPSSPHTSGEGQSFSFAHGGCGVAANPKNRSKRTCVMNISGWVWC